MKNDRSHECWLSAKLSFVRSRPYRANRREKCLMIEDKYATSAMPDRHALLLGLDLALTSSSIVRALLAARSAFDFSISAIA